jgi:hypothetical protein
MKERPILFGGPMVRAILDGRKTVTRRLVKPRPTLALNTRANTSGAFIDRRKVNAHSIADVLVRCPHGKPGDRLWVRETFATDVPGCPDGLSYRADHRDPRGDGPANQMRWRPSIHMPRWASRITLEIVDVRVERLCEIDQQDAEREGIDRFGGGWRDYLHDDEALITGPASFATLWESINGPGSWDANPWIWRVEFRRVEP